MENQTLAQVLAVDEEANQLSEATQAKIQELKDEKDSQIEQIEQEAKAEYRQYVESLASSNQEALENYKRQGDEKNQKRIAKLVEDYQAHKASIVDYIVEEVKKVYVNC